MIVPLQWKKKSMRRLKSTVPKAWLTFMDKLDCHDTGCFFGVFLAKVMQVALAQGSLQSAGHAEEEHAAKIRGLCICSKVTCTLQILNAWMCSADPALRGAWAECRRADGISGSHSRIKLHGRARCHHSPLLAARPAAARRPGCPQHLWPQPTQTHL